MANIASPSRNAPANVRESTSTSLGGVISVELTVDEVGGQPEKNEKDDGQQQDDREDLPPQRLPQRVLDDDGDRAQSVSPPTASR